MRTSAASKGPQLAHKLIPLVPTPTPIKLRARETGLPPRQLHKRYSENKQADPGAVATRFQALLDRENQTASARLENGRAASLRAFFRDQRCIAPGGWQFPPKSPENPNSNVLIYLSTEWINLRKASGKQGLGFPSSLEPQEFWRDAVAGNTDVKSWYDKCEKTKSLPAD
jgi:hypothetical protein